MAKWALQRENHGSQPEREPLENIGQLRGWLMELCQEGRSNFYLHNEDTGDELTVLMKAPHAAVSLMRGSDFGSSSATVNPAFRPKAPADWETFSVEAAPARVPRDRCVPLDTMVKIVEHVYEHGSLPEWIAWREE